VTKIKLIQPQDRLGMSREETAEYIGVSPGTFDRMVEDGRMPPAKMINTRKVWHRPAVEKAFAKLPDAGQDAESDSVWSDCA